MTNEFLKKYKNNLIIKESQINILKKYEIDFFKIDNYQTLLYLIEEVLNKWDLTDEEYEEIDNIALEIQERNYYQNTNK